MGKLLGLAAVVSLLAGGYAMATREPAPDRRPIVLPETLDGLPRASATSSADYRQRMEDKTRKGWSGRTAEFGLYTSDSTRLARVADLAGPHVFVVRGRFDGKGDAHFSEQSKREGFDVETEKRQIGPNSCEWTSTLITVCWRETDRLSVSVLTMDRSDVERVSRQVDEVWAAVS